MTPHHCSHPFWCGDATAFPNDWSPQPYLRGSEFPLYTSINTIFQSLIIDLLIDDLRNTDWSRDRELCFHCQLSVYHDRLVQSPHHCRCCTNLLATKTEVRIINSQVKPLIIIYMSWFCCLETNKRFSCYKNQVLESLDKT